jgi:cytochrome c551/c552
MLLALARLAGSLAVALAAAGCGDGGGDGAADRAQGDLAQGRELYVGGKNGKLGCGFCHTLKAAGTVGQFGPDLDDEYALDRANGFSDAKIRRELLSWIRKGNCVDPNDPSRCMPKGLVTGADAVSVAAFVAKCSGRSGTPPCRLLAGSKLSGEAANGERPYARLGCVSCHYMSGNAAIGPSFKGLAGSNVKLTNGQTVSADDAYLLESIVAPDAKIVEGFPRGLMSARVPPGSVSIARAKAIVVYINTLK